MIKRLNVNIKLMSINILINGDRNLFLSKASIDRFKKEVREKNTDMIDSIDSTAYLKEGYSFRYNMNVVTKDVTATIITIQEEQLDVKRKQLRERLNNAARGRSGEAKRHLSSVKRTVPDKLYKSYANLMTNFKLPNIPSPNEVIADVEKYRQQISTIMGTLGQVSNDNNVSRAIKNYFNTLGAFVGIEALEVPSMPTADIVTKQEVNSDTEDEDDDAPVLTKSV